MGRLTTNQKTSKQDYILHLTRMQVIVLSYACERFARLICGQDWVLRELMESAWEKRSKEATGNPTSLVYDCGWREMRRETDDLCKRIKKRFWGLSDDEYKDIHYDQYADILFDIHQVLKHRIWTEIPEDERWTCDGNAPMRFGKEPLAKIERVKD